MENVCKAFRYNLKCWRLGVWILSKSDFVRNSCEAASNKTDNEILDAHYPVDINIV